MILLSLINSMIIIIKVLNTLRYLYPCRIYVSIIFFKSKSSLHNLRNVHSIRIYKKAFRTYKIGNIIIWPYNVIRYHSPSVAYFIKKHYNRSVLQHAGLGCCLIMSVSFFYTGQKLASKKVKNNWNLVLILIILYHVTKVNFVTLSLLKIERWT